MSARYNPELVLCRKQTGISVGRLCARCEGKCVMCDSYVRAHTPVRICDECNFMQQQQRETSTSIASDQSSSGGKCIICNGRGVSDAYYCRSCVMLQRDRDGCPKVVNISTSYKDYFYEKKGSGSAFNYYN
ncbi:hypothetical protein MP228_010515 [Amoeboaphelidium protococcarum]|nr:hypothetical protein MP228_012791 [Amoeboaphelidium protococcarum]KAI3644351.1 hypothetical protein MP228_010515 [Amoeboaphelidium protococcarum]